MVDRSTSGISLPASENDARFVPRVAFFADSFHEVNGVALTSRQLDAFAKRRGLPFLSAHVGPANSLQTTGFLTTLELRRGPAAFPIERDMSFDPLFSRHFRRVAAILRQFRPDVLHITGPSDIGILGAALAYRLRIPLVASWHTNLHEFAGRRLAKLISFLPQEPRQRTVNLAERSSLQIVSRFYRLARVLMAPNQELVELLTRLTGKHAFLMQRGSDTVLFDPAKRKRDDSAFILGYVGRVTPEKSVRFLVELERGLLQAGIANYRFLVVGDGSERPWLAAHLQQAELPGVLTGEALAAAYANMDLFVFPSHTDTFGNVVVEALASGVPAVVTASGGPKYLVQPGVTGKIAESDAAFVAAVRDIMANPDLHGRMRMAARDYALSISWDSVFEKVYDVYRYGISR